MNRERQLAATFAQYLLCTLRLAMPTASDPDQGAPPPVPTLSPAVAARIAHAFGFRPADTLEDAERVATWSGQADDLLVWLERRYHWTARSAFVYLLSLKGALRNTKPDPQ